MKLSIKNTFRNLAIAALGAAVLSACGGVGSCTTCSSNTGNLANLTMAAPSSYPAGVAVTIPVVVTNNGTETINNLNYTIDSASNTTGGTITIQAASATSCRIIAAKASCTLSAEIAATPTSHPGSFSVVTSQGAPASGLRAFLTSSILSVNVGLVQMPTNTSSGADGLTLYYPSAIVGTANSTSQVIITAIVTSANAGSFNTIELVDGSGNPLSYSVLSGNSGTGKANLPFGSVVSFLVTVPSGSTQVQFKAQTSTDGANKSTATNSNTVVVTNPATPTGIMNVSPNYFSLTTDYEDQIITLSNSGNGPISSIAFTPSSPLQELSNNCATTLAAGATCQYVLTFNQNVQESGTGTVKVNYNNGINPESSTVTVNYGVSITVSPGMVSIFSGGSSTVTVNLSGGYQITDQVISLTDVSSATDGITISPNQCVVNSTTTSCSFTVQTLASTPSSNYPLTVGHGSITPNITTVTVRVLSSAQTQMLLAQSSAYGCMLKVTSNIAYCWGSNRNGELGNGTNINTATPTAVLTGGTSAIPIIAQLTGITAGSASGGLASSCVISADGNMYCWGWGGQGALGNNSTSDSNIPVAVLKGGASAISNDTILTFASTCGANSCAVDSTGNAYCWGYGGNGELGNGSTTSSNIPVAVLKGGSSAIESSAKITSISIGYHYGCAVDSDGDAYCWGQNPKGNFGNNTTTASNVPVKVLKGGSSAIGVSEKIIQISVTKDHSNLLALTTCAVTDAGNAYCWGYNTHGAIGNNSTIDSNVPVLVLSGGSSAIPLSAKFTNIETSGQTTCAVADGLGYCWGQNQRGQVGDNSTTTTLVAKSVIVGGSSAIPSGVSFLNIGTGFDDAYNNAMSSCSQGSDNKFYCWGDNTYGELGGGTIGTPPYSSLPVQVLIP